MKILLTNSTDIYGGGEFYVLELAGSLQARGHDVLVVCKPGNLLYEKCRSAGVPVRPIDFPPQGKLLAHILKLKSIIREQRSQIVHTNSNYDRTAGGFAARLTRAVHVTNVHSFHSLSHNITHWLRNTQATDHFIVDGACVKDLLVREDHIPAEQITVVYLGVDPEAMRRLDAARTKIRAEFGFSGAETVIGNVARLVPFKGQEFLLRAFAEVQRKHPASRLLLIGDGELLDMLIGLARTLQVDKHVVFAGFRDDLQAVYSAIDIYAHASVEGGGETFPFAVLQALATELPVVATQVGDVAEMVQDGLSGFLVSERDVNELAANLASLVGDASLRQQMGRAGRELLLRRFTVDSMVDTVEELYNSALSSRL